MIPHRLDAPASPGPSTGRRAGLTGAVDLAEVALGAAALRASRALLPAEDALAAGRFRDDLAWIRTHPDGVEASNAKTTPAPAGRSRPRVSPASSAIGPCSRSAARASPRSPSRTPGRPAVRFPRSSRAPPPGCALFPFDVITGLAAALPTKDNSRLTCALPDGRCLVHRLALLAPSMADKGAWRKMFSSLPTPPPHRPTRRSRSSPT